MSECLWPCNRLATCPGLGSGIPLSLKEIQLVKKMDGRTEVFNLLKVYIYPIFGLKNIKKNTKFWNGLKKKEN